MVRLPLSVGSICQVGWQIGFPIFLSQSDSRCLGIAQLGLSVFVPCLLGWSACVDMSPRKCIWCCCGWTCSLGMLRDDVCPVRSVGTAASAWPPPVSSSLLAGIPFWVSTAFLIRFSHLGALSIGFRRENSSFSH